MSHARYRAVPLDGFTIVLDLLEDEYRAVPQQSYVPEENRHDVVEALGATDVDVEFPTPDLIPRAKWDLDDCGHLARPNIRIRDCALLLRAVPAALWSFKFGRPSTWIHRHSEPAPSASDAVVEAACRFRRMRPFVPLLSRCLPHALLLQAYLRASGLEADLVIGVRLFPFQAHSWVQAGHVVLTDDLELTAGYTPIAAG